MRVCDYVCMRVTKVYVSYYSRALFMCDILERNLTRCLSLGCVLFYTHTHTHTDTHTLYKRIFGHKALSQIGK